MKIAIRADASRGLGTGHVIRCLSLAESLRAQGAEVRFIARDLPGGLLVRVVESGFALERIPPAGTETGTDIDPPIDSTEDAAATCRIIRAAWATADCIVVDHYSLDAGWESEVRSASRAIVAIDDLADREHDCDILLDQNLHEYPEARYSSLVPAGCRMLMGPRYALLRPEFAEARRTLQARNGIVRRILISFGLSAGAESEGIRVLRALVSLDPATRPDADLVLGAEPPHLEEIQRLCESANARCHARWSDMPAMMVAADLAIGAGGSTIWERCSLGLPSIAIAMTRNQAECSREPGKRGLHVYLGSSESIETATIASALTDALSVPDELAAMSRRCLDEVDAMGASRVASSILSG